METTAPPGRESNESLSAELQILIATYTAPQRLRSHHKAKIKRIISLKQGQDGKVAYCYFCKRLGNCDVDMQLHHLDRIESHNQLANLEIAHQVCNNIENQKYRQSVLKAEREVAQRLSSPSPVRESERESTVAGGSQIHPYESDNAQGQEWSSREGEKHDVMRAKWDSWIMDNVNGPFKNRRIFLLFKELSYMAPRALGMGSSVTYRRYIMEDHYGGILQVFIDEKDGLRKVKLRVEPETEKVN